MNIIEDDIPVVTDLNQKFLPAVGLLGIENMNHFLIISSYFKIIKVNENLVGFMIGLLPGVDYESVNYKWFSDNYSSFTYVDRIVIAKKYQNRGLGNLFYDDFKNSFKNQADLICCEVNIRPQNKQSMRFHKNYGFKEVGRQNVENNKKTVSYMVYHIDK